MRVRKDGASAADLVLDCRAGRVPMIAFSPDGGFLATAAAEGVVRVWDLASGRQIHEFAALNRTSRTVAVSPDARLIAAGYDARTVIVWDAESGSRVCSIDGLPWSPYDLKFEPRGNVLFTVGNGGEIIALDPRAGIELAKLSVHNRAIFSLHISPDGRRLYTSGQDPWIGITDLERLRSYIRGNEEYWMNPPPATIAPGVSTPGAGWRD